MKREVLSTLVVVLFIGLALAPSINADVCKASLEDEFINYEEMQPRLIDSFSNILTNETFIQIMRSPEIQSALTSDAFVQFYESAPSQKILQSQVFNDLLSSEDFQKFQANLLHSPEQDIRQNNVQDTPTAGQILLFIIVWFIVGFVLWIPAVFILFAVGVPLGSMWAIIGLVVKNMGELSIFVPFVMIIIATILTIIWPIFAIWFVYCILTWYGLFPEIWG